MPEETTASIVIRAPADHVMAVIADFAAYPEWASAVKAVEVLATTTAGRGERVRFVLDAGPVKDTYELAYTWAADGNAVSWELIKAQMQKTQNGSYTLVSAGEDTEVTYRLRVDLTIPLIGMFKRKAEKVITDAALKELKKRVEG